MIGEHAQAEQHEVPFPLVDLHVHLDGSTLADVLALSRERKVRFGIVEHAGTKENVYPVVLSDDAELEAYVERLEGEPVFKGVQAEYSDWRPCFSAEALGRLDYVLTDAMTMPGPDGRRMKLWEKEAVLGDAQTFMDRYVDWHVERMTADPVDLFANLTWLPDPFAADYDALWTEARMSRIIEAAVKHSVALEISSSFKVPRLSFLRLAKAAGASFALGSNGRYPKMGLLDYAVQTAVELGLTEADMFVPGTKPLRAARDIA